MFAIITAATFFLLVATLVPCLRMQAWWVRDFDFPRLQIAALCALLLLVAWWQLPPAAASTWLLMAIAGGCFAWQAWWIAPYSPLFPKEVSDAAEGEGRATLKIVSANVLMDNRNAAAVIAQVERHRPDIFIALETDHWWQQQLEVLEADYPWSLKCPLDNRYGMHVYSRVAIHDPEIQFLLAENIPSMHFTALLKGGRGVAVHCVHPTPPSPTENDESGERDAELIMVGRAVAGCDHPVIVTGDLNDVAWSSTTRLFRKISGLLDPRVGRGMFNTFHAAYPFLRWPLDHLFHSDHFALVHMERLGKTGSDHFPILVELALFSQRQDAEEGLEPDTDDRDRARTILADEGAQPGAVHRPKGAR